MLFVLVFLTSRHYSPPDWPTFEFRPGYSWPIWSFGLLSIHRARHTRRVGELFLFLLFRTTITLTRQCFHAIYSTAPHTASVTTYYTLHISFNNKQQNHTKQQHNTTDIIWQS